MAAGSSPHPGASGDAATVGRRPHSHGPDQGSQDTVPFDVVGEVHSGPRGVCATGRVMKPSGPACAAPLNGVAPLTPHGAASAGSLNQNPRWNVFVGPRLASGSKPKI